ncbi:cell division control protein 7 [Nematocida sp. LUAm3]|nr:cell division control protein 7 [Nematocida sp. LUAm3]KAI5174721.1 cell division control protein 7 [Nematocida sp. LUAm2]KAI5177868.1 cell division control protein 7 [Nematocida sp. LUAm1]
MEEGKKDEEFELIKKIGEGTFSSVYLAKHHEIEKNVAIKKITQTTAPSRIVNEIKLLIDLKGERNIIPLLSLARKGRDVYMVFPYVKSIDFKELLMRRTLADIKAYTYHLLLALESVHAQGIIHRDIKPSNFLYDFEGKEGLLIDFGLSQKIERKENEEDVPEKKKRFFFSTCTMKTHSQSKGTQPPGYLLRDSRPAMEAIRSGTRGFRAPEVLFRVEKQSTAIDIWSAGIILLTLLTKKYPFFAAKDDIGSLIEIGEIFGGKEMRSAAKFYKRIWRSNIEEIATKITFKEIVKKCSSGEKEFPDTLFDLLEKMLSLKSSERITAEEALRHKFFDNL